MATEFASNIQAAHINPDPDLAQDAAPATAADQKETVSLHGLSRGEKLEVVDDDKLLSHNDDDDDDLSTEFSEEVDDIPYSAIRPAPRNKNQMPPLPDLRFEQSYLNSIKGADTWWKVALITTRDQIMMPLIQGVVYNLVLCGWQSWNRNARLHGNTVGARVRRWWWKTNNWTIPAPGSRR